MSGFALIPAVITALLDTYLLRSLSQDLTSRHADTLTREAINQMEQLATHYAEILDGESRRIETLVQLQAREAQRLLEVNETSAKAMEITPAQNAASTALEFHRFVDPNPNINHRQRQLAPMADFYRLTSAPQDRAMVWQYVVLEEGLALTHPAHGAYPPDFDPRQRPWYLAQKAAPRFRWYRPHFDATTGALVINATAPLVDDNGNYLGLAGIDVDLNKIFATLALPAQLSAGSELMQVAALTPPLVDEPMVVVLARQHQPNTNIDWRSLPQLERLTLGSKDTTETLWQEMLSGQNGYLIASLDGVDSAILYRRFGREVTYVVMSVPIKTATRAAFASREYAADTTRAHIVRLLAVLAACSIIMIVAALAFSRFLTRPIERLKVVVEQLAKGDFSARAGLTTGDELQVLGDAIDTAIPQLKRHTRVQESLAVAHEIQQQLLPPQAPQLAGYDIAGQSLYSDETGGDYFDFMPLYLNGSERQAALIADVSGHGIGPALLMATTRALLHGARGQVAAIDQLMTRVNQQLTDDLSHGHFVTLFLLTLDGNTGQLQWCSAGHDSAYILRGPEQAQRQLDGDDIPLGIDAEWQYHAYDGETLKLGEVLLLGTDGIWETSNPDGEQFGKERLCEYVKSHCNLSAASLCDGIMQALDEFRGHDQRHDDTSIVIIKRLATMPSESSATSTAPVSQQP